MALSELQNEFIDWLLEEGDHKTKGTQNAWARDHKVPVSTVATWRNQKPFQDEYVRRLNQEGVGEVQFAEVRNAALKRALTGDPKSIETWMKLVNQTHPDLFKPAPVAEVPVQGMTQEELQRALKST